jgi:hypothetical protein
MSTISFIRNIDIEAMDPMYLCLNQAYVNILFNRQGDGTGKAGFVENTPVVRRYA